MKKEINQDKKTSFEDEQSNPSALNRENRCKSGAAEGGVIKKRQTYHIYLDLIQKVRAYAYWERVGVSEVVNYALEQFLANKKVKQLPPKGALLKEK